MCFCTFQRGFRVVSVSRFLYASLCGESFHYAVEHTIDVRRASGRAVRFGDVEVFVEAYVEGNGVEGKDFRETFKPLLHHSFRSPRVGASVSAIYDFVQIAQQAVPLLFRSLLPEGPSETDRRGYAQTQREKRSQNIT